MSETTTEPTAPGIETAPEAETSAAKGDSRSFPCETCGADMQFHIGVQSLKCGYCGFVKQLPGSGAAIEEQDFAAMLAKLEQVRDGGRHDEAGFSEVRCDGCGGTVRFAGTLTSQECVYCGSPLQLTDVHDAPHRVPVDGVLPFQIDRQRARRNLKEWIRSRWFAPNEFRRRGAQGKFSGVYTPYWTYDSMTTTHYSGERGEHYYVTVGSGKNKRRVQRTRWYPASGTFQRFFDDVPVVASTGLSDTRVRELEPWPMTRCVPFRDEMLTGFLARTYDLELGAGFERARERIDAAIRSEARRRIGGDTQRIHSVHSRFDAVTYKHLLLPIWLLAYRFNKKAYQVVINGATGEVQGDRPYSWVKIGLASLAAVVTIAVIALLAGR